MPIIGVIGSSGDRNVPDAPTIGTATNVPSGRAFNNGRADVTFTAPVYTGGTPITGYTVTSSPGGFTGTGASSPISVTGLQSNVSYTFTVTATNAVGTSAPSAASNSITATTVPQAPTIGTATDLGTGTSVSVGFTANATGGSAITGFTATSSPGSITGTGGSSPITVNGLTAGTAYTFTVTATNANGTSAPSAASNSVTPVVPGDYESIASFTTSATSYTFSNIPQTYRHLEIRWSYSNASGGGALQCNFNGGTSTVATWGLSAYNFNMVNVNVTAGTQQMVAYNNLGMQASSRPNVGIMQIPNYVVAKAQTSIIFSGNDDDFQGQCSYYVTSHNTAEAITSINFNNLNPASGQVTFALYGIKG